MRPIEGLDVRKRGHRHVVNFRLLGEPYSWTVLSTNIPDVAPDFIFDEQEQGFDPDPSQTPALLAWGLSKQPPSLNHVVKEMVQAYYSYRQSLLATHPNRYIQESFHSCKSLHGIKVDAVAQLPPLNPAGASGAQTSPMFSPACFRFILEGLSCPDEHVQSLLLSAPPQLLVTLAVDVETGSISPADPDRLAGVFPRASVEIAMHSSLSDRLKTRLPELRSKSPLKDFVVESRNSIQAALSKLVDVRKLRQDYLSAMLAQFGRAALEWDQVDNRKMSFLVENEIMPAVLVVELPDGFPETMPVVTLYSIFHDTSSGKPLSYTFDDIPYSPRWDAVTMVERLKLRLPDLLLQMKQRGLPVASRTAIPPSAPAMPSSHSHSHSRLDASGAHDARRTPPSYEDAMRTSSEHTSYQSSSSLSASRNAGYNNTYGGGQRHQPSSGHQPQPPQRDHYPSGGPFV